MPLRVDFRPVQSERFRASATPDDVPSIFLDRQVTRAVAIMAGIGPVNTKILKQMMPYGKAIIAARELRKLERLGLVYGYEALELWGSPHIVGLNRGYAGYNEVNALALSLWRHVVSKRVRSIPSSPFAFREQHQKPGDKATLAWRGIQTGRLLHLLAELEDGEEIYVAAVAEILGTRRLIHTHFDRFVGFGIVGERYAEARRYLRLDPKYHSYRALRDYLRWVNRTAHPEFAEMMNRYREECRRGERSWSFLVRRGRERKRRSRISRQKIS